MHLSLSDELHFNRDDKEKTDSFFLKNLSFEYRNWDHFKATIDIESEIADVANQIITTCCWSRKSILKGPFLVKLLGLPQGS
jgi:hypothetical protein